MIMTAKCIIMNIQTSGFFVESRRCFLYFASELVNTLASDQCWSNVVKSTPTFPPNTHVGPTCPCYLGKKTLVHDVNMTILISFLAS